MMIVQELVPEPDQEHSVVALVLARLVVALELQVIELQAEPFELEQEPEPLLVSQEQLLERVLVHLCVPRELLAAREHP